MESNNFLKRLGGVGLVLVLLIVPPLTACGSSQASPTPSTGSETKEAPAASQLTKTEAKEVSTPVSKAQQKDKQAAPVKSREPYAVEIHSWAPGSTTYVMGVALADMINRSSTWLKATSVASKGTTVNTKTLFSEPERRKNTLIWANLSDHFLANAGRLPGMPNQKYETLRVVTLVGAIGNGLVTLDPNIKNIRDFAGKRFAVGPKGAWGLDEKVKALFRAAGVEASIKFENMDYDTAKDALRDGLVDGAIAAVIYIGGGKWVGNPAMEELITTKQVHFVKWNQEDGEKAAQLLDVPPEVFPTYVIPAGTITPTQEPWSVNNSYMLWSADLEMPEDVVYEITRIVYENVDEFGKYHISGKAISKATMSSSESDDPGRVHPGALKFYKEKGLKLGPIDYK